MKDRPEFELTKDTPYLASCVIYGVSIVGILQTPGVW